MRVGAYNDTKLHNPGLFFCGIQHMAYVRVSYAKEIDDEIGRANSRSTSLKTHTLSLA